LSTIQIIYIAIALTVYIECWDNGNPISR